MIYRADFGTIRIHFRKIFGKKGIRHLCCQSVKQRIYNAERVATWILRYKQLAKDLCLPDAEDQLNALLNTFLVEVWTNHLQGNFISLIKILAKQIGALSFSFSRTFLRCQLCGKKQISHVLWVIHACLMVLHLFPFHFPPFHQAGLLPMGSLFNISCIHIFRFDKHKL